MKYRRDRGLLTLILAALLPCMLMRFNALAAEGIHTFTGPNGTTLEAEILDMVDGKVVIRRVSDGQRFELPGNQLAAADVEFMRGWLAAREAGLHPLGWKRVRIYLPSFADEVSAPGIPAAFRRIDVRTWEAELPEGAWLLLTIWREDGAKFAPQFLLPFEGSPEWFIGYGDRRLTRALGPDEKSETVGVLIGAKDGEAELREMKKEIPPGGVALCCEYLEADDFRALGIGVISAVVGEVPSFSVAKDAKLRAFRMEELMRDSGGLSGWDELECLDVRCSGDWPLTDCAALKGLTTLVVDGDVSLATASADGAFPQLRHLSLERAGIDDPDAFAGFAAGLEKLHSLSLPNEAVLNVSALVGSSELTALALGDKCGDPSAQALSALSNLTVLLLRDNYPAGEIEVLVNAGHFSQLRTLGMGPREILPLANFPQLRELRLDVRGGAIDDAADVVMDFGRLSLPNSVNLLQLSHATSDDLAALTSVAGVERIESLVLSYPSAAELGALNALDGLQWLSVEDQLLTVEDKLVALDVSGFSRLRGLSLLRLQNLTQLRLGAPSLEALSVRSCSELKPVGGAADGIADKVILAR